MINCFRPWMSEMLFLIYWQKQCSNTFVLYCFYHCQILHNSVTRYPIEMGVCIKMKQFEVMRKWCKKIEIEIFDKWLISLDRVTYIFLCECEFNLSDFRIPSLVDLVVIFRKCLPGLILFHLENYTVTLARVPKGSVFSGCVQKESGCVLGRTCWCHSTVCTGVSHSKDYNVSDCPLLLLFQQTPQRTHQT